MFDVVHLLFEYRALVVDDHNGVLTPGKAKRLRSLERLFGQDPEDSCGPHRNRKHARCDTHVPALITHSGRTQPVDVVNLGGGGVRVEPAPDLTQGESATLIIQCTDDNSVYRVQVRAEWMSPRATRSAMGMRFVSSPVHLAKVA